MIYSIRMRGVAQAVLLGLAFALAACAGAASRPPSSPPPSTPFYHLVDITGAYTAFYDRTQSMPAAERVAAFKSDMNQIFPGFYALGRPGAPSTEEKLN